MPAVAVRTGNWFFFFLLPCVFLPFPNNIRRRHIVTFVTFFTQHICFSIADALLPSVAIFVFLLSLWLK
jgi:hypothetical protein